MGFFSKLLGGLGVASGGGDFYANLLGLAPGETMVFTVTGCFVVGESEFADGTVTLGGGYLLAQTSTGRLVLGDLQTMKPEHARSFTPGTLTVEDRGFLGEDGSIFSRKKDRKQAGPTGQMERTKVIRCTPHEGAPFAIMVVESQVTELLRRAGN